MDDCAVNANSGATTTVSTMLTKADICAEARVSLSYVNKLLASGVLPYVKLGRAVRVRRVDWAQFIANSTAWGE